MSDLPAEGDVFDGKYTIGHVLGTGGMAAVLAARHMGLDENVAIKILLPDCCDDPAVVERFVQEGRTAIKIRSEHVVRMFDVGVVSGHAYLVMEYLQGQDFGALLRESGPLPLQTAIDLVLQACEAIGEGHTLGIVHRDLKPANLFLTHRADGSPCVKVLDFGISKMPRGAAGATGGPAPTLPSMVMGSPQYMSPEQMMSAASAEPRSDIWSLGTILYELLSGQVAFDGSNTTEICARVLQGSTVPLLQLRAELPDDVVQAIARCLEKDAARRFSDVGELARALAPFGTAGARASAASITRILEGEVAGPAVRPRAPVPLEPGTMKPTAAEILAVVPSGRRRWPGYLMVSSLAIVALLGGVVAFGGGYFRALLPRSAESPPLTVAAASPRVESSSSASLPGSVASSVAPPAVVRRPHHAPDHAPAAAPSARPSMAVDAGAPAEDDDPYAAPAADPEVQP